MSKGRPIVIVPALPGPWQSRNGNDELAVERLYMDENSGKAIKGGTCVGYP